MLPEIPRGSLEVNTWETILSPNECRNHPMVLHSSFPTPPRRLLTPQSGSRQAAANIFTAESKASWNCRPSITFGTHRDLIDVDTKQWGFPRVPLIYFAEGECMGPDDASFLGMTLETMRRSQPNPTVNGWNESEESPLGNHGIPRGWLSWKP